MVVETRTSTSLLTSLSAVMPAASGRPAQPPWRAGAAPPPLAEEAGSMTNSLIVFQAPHSPHWPCHLLEESPHSLQT